MEISREKDEMVTDRIIEDGKVYLKEEFLVRAGMSQHSYRNARRRGLKVIPAGRRVYVRGSDFLAYLDRLSKAADVPQTSGAGN